MLEKFRTIVLVQHTVHDVQLPVPGCTWFCSVHPTSSQRRIGEIVVLLKNWNTLKHFADGQPQPAPLHIRVFLIPGPIINNSKQGQQHLRSDIGKTYRKRRLEPDWIRDTFLG
jgi:hypothetical protein